MRAPYCAIAASSTLVAPVPGRLTENTVKAKCTDENFRISRLGVALIKPVLGIGVLSLLLVGCAPYQTSQNADELVENISDLRESQVIYNIERAIDNPDMVPAQVVINQGTAQTSTSLTPTLSWGVHFVKSLSAQLGVFSWTSIWQLTPVTDGGDLQNLRAVYGFIVSTPPTAEAATSSQRINAAAALLQSYGNPPTKNLSQTQLVPRLPTREDAANMLIGGQSWACQKYQSEKEKTELYNLWLFWYRGGYWYPQKPNPRYTLIPLANHGDAQIYITSRACFDDFIILVQSSIPLTHAAAAAGPKTPGTVPAPAQ